MSSPPPEAPREAPLEAGAGTWSWRLALAALVLLAVHLLLLRYNFGSPVIPDIAFNRGDFGTHAAQVRRVLEALETAGEPWAYDVQLLAGAPNGVLFDADNKFWELWTWALVKLGVGEGKAFNAFVFALHLVMPAVVYAAARLFRLERGPALTATGLAIALWSFDSFTRWMWYIGTVSYVFVAYFALFPLALFHRWIEDRKPGFALACAMTMALAHLVHPYVFFILVAPMLAEYVRAGFVERSLTAAEHAITVGIAALTLVVNFWWLRTAMEFWHYILDSAFYEQGGVQFAFFDLFGLLVDSSTQGMIGPRTAVRLVCLIAAILALRSWRSLGDRRRLPLLALMVTMAGFAFLGGYTPIAQLQPYRHNLPFGFALLIPAGLWLHRTLAARPWRSLDPGGKALTGIVAALALLHLGRDALYFFAPVLPDRQQVEGGREIYMGALGHALTPSYRYTEQNEWEGLIAWIRANDDGQGRWLVQDQVLGEYLMARTDAQLIGGFLVRNIEHSDANWFRREGVEPPYDAAQLRAYFETYGVRWVIVQKLDMSPWWDEQRDLLVRSKVVDKTIVYRVRANFPLAYGPGASKRTQVEASINRISVRGSDPDQDLVLRYHWMEQLRCVPDCTIAREPVEGDRVGFLRIPAPHPAEFAVENHYGR